MIKDEQNEKPSQEMILKFQHKVFAFYKKQSRSLPWRLTTDPYRILLSEIMLQQTQVERVIPYYTQWTQKWPTSGALARASRTDVLKEWLGLGYNNRAVRLHQTSSIIHHNYKGDVLRALQDYHSLPGIGKYTAYAVRIFSTNDDIVTVDTNIRRILIHEFSLSQEISKTELWILAEKCLPKGRSRRWHNALMDYGALVHTSRRTGIAPITQQDVFEGSDRQIRSLVLRHMLRYPDKNLTGEELISLVSKDTEKKRGKKIILGLSKDGLVVEKNGIISLAQ